MARTMNLASRIRDALPQEHVDLLEAAAAAAKERHVYLVGGNNGSGPIASVESIPQ